jgi:hypothetical protein
MPQLISIMLKMPRFLPHSNCLNLRWPYQANVMNIFEITSYRIVFQPFIMQQVFCGSGKNIKPVPYSRHGFH